MLLISDLCSPLVVLKLDSMAADTPVVLIIIGYIKLFILHAHHLLCSEIFHAQLSVASSIASSS